MSCISYETAEEKQRPELYFMLPWIFYNLALLIRHVSLIFANSSISLVDGTQIPPRMNQISFPFTTVQRPISQSLWKSWGWLSGRMYLLVWPPRCQQECRGCTLEPWCFGFPQQQQLIQARSIIKTIVAVRERI